MDTDHSGAVTIYFRPAGNSDSYWQPFGGYFYIEKDHEVNVQVAEGSGDAYVIRNGNHETTFTAPRLMTIEVVASAGTHYELDRVELWKKYGNDGPELERVLDGVIFVMGDYDVIVKVYFKYAAHDLVKTEAKDPTCTEPGNTAYWTCTRCGKFFSDAEGQTEIEEAAIKVVVGTEKKTRVMSEHEKKYSEMGVPIKMGIFRMTDRKVEIDPLRWGLPRKKEETDESADQE